MNSVKQARLLYLCLLAFCTLACQRSGKEEQIRQSQTGTPPHSTKKEFKLFTHRSPSSTGIFFSNDLEESPYRNILLYQYYYNGGGVALGDINNDGHTDIFLTANMGSNKLYLNQGGFRFEDISLQAGLGKSTEPGWYTGATMVDINHDGFLDIYVCRSGNLQPENRRNLLYVNNQDSTFTENAAFYGLDDPGYSVQTSFFDYDKDGDLDMFLINHGLDYYGHLPAYTSRTRDPYIGDKLFRNEEGRFVDVSAEAGILGSKEGFGLGVSVADVDNDGWDDIYVSNDFFEHDYLYVNQRDGTFRESIKSATRQIPFFSMGVDMADFNNDGWQDIMALDMAIEDNRRQKTNLAGISNFQFWQFVDKGYHYQYMYNSLQLNNGPDPKGNISFSNIARLAGVFQTDWSWAALFADLDNDGWKDLLVTNGLRKDVMNNDFIAGLNQNLDKMHSTFTDLSPQKAQEFLDQMPSEKVRNYLFHNQGDLTFKNKAEEWGLDALTFSSGAAYGDLDNDGDLDLVINNLEGEAGVYENNAESAPGKNNFFRLKLKGDAKNPFGIGTKVTLYKNDSLQVQQLYPTRGFQSSVEPILHFGVNQWEELDSVKIEWPDRKVIVLTHVPTNQHITVEHYYALKDPEKQVEKEDKLFQDVTQQVAVDYRHQESKYDDFALELLLPRKFSSEGPCLQTGDVDGDGFDDLFIGGAKGQAGQLYLQTRQGRFAKATKQPWVQDKEHEDVNALFFDADGDGDQDLYVASGSNEFGPGADLLQDRLYTNDGKGNFIKSAGKLPQLPYNTSSVVAADFDQDKDLDLFIGGGVEPQRYPLSSRSFLLENKEGTFVDVTETKAPELRQPGIVSQALWEDYNGDGWPDLMVVGEWMPIRFYKNQRGTLQPDSTFVKLKMNGQRISQGLTTGWWNCMVPIDLDQDGDRDYLLGNMGRNYRFHPGQEDPLEIFAGDFDDTGKNKIILGYYQNGQLYPIHGREDLTIGMPSLKKKFNTYAAYSRATVEDLLSQFPSSYQLHLKAHMFESVVLQNEGQGNFVVKPLPPQAQISSVQDILVQDFDQDGLSDALLVGNFYEIETKTPRDDAGIGLLLKGGQEGSLKAVPMSKSGFYVPYNARKLAFVETAKGSLVIVASNNQELQVFKVDEKVTQ